jgi:MFS family permease
MCDSQLVTDDDRVAVGKAQSLMHGQRADGDSAEPIRTPLGSGFRLLWTSTALSNLADGILKVALPLLATRFTESPALIAGLALALTLPWLLFALPAGALTDRVDRRRAMLVANTIRGCLLAALAVGVVVGAGSIWVLFAAAFCVGIAETIYDTSAQSILPQVVTHGQLPRANGLLFAAETTSNQFIGPPLGGLLVTAGAAVAFVTPAALWAAAVGVLLLVRGSFRVQRTQRTTIRADIAEGLHFLWRHRLLRTLAVMVGVLSFAGSAAWAIFVLFAVGPASAMGLSDTAYGLLLTTAAAGGLLGALVAGRVQRVLGRARSLVLTIFGCALMVGAPAVTATPYLIGVAFVLGGAGVSIWNVITVSLRQQITPVRLLGRVNSAYRVVAWGTMPLGAAAGGLLGQFLGLRAVFVIMAALSLSMLAGMRIVTNARMDAAERDAEHRAAPA